MVQAVKPGFDEIERDIVDFIARGYTRIAVAEALGIKVRKAKWLEMRLALKLGVTRRREIPFAYMRLTGDDPYPRP